MGDVRLKTDSNWPHSEENREIHEEILRAEGEGTKVTVQAVSAVTTASSDKKVRVGMGGEFLFPIRHEGRIALGIRYLSYPWKSESLWDGHRFELFLDLPKYVGWGRIQGGIYGEVAGLTSYERFSREGHYGFMGGVEYYLWEPTDSARLSLDIKAGLGFGWPEAKQTLLQGGIIFGGDIDF